MYLTAHRVTSAKDGRTGVNSFFHKHNQLIGVDSSWGGTDVHRVANENPGDLVDQETTVPPGGNSVLSYLEVICEDDTDSTVVTDVVNRFEDVVETEHVWNECGVLVLFSSIRGLAGQEVLEFQALKKGVLELLDRVSYLDLGIRETETVRETEE